MKVHATQPKKDNGELPEMSTKDFLRDLLQITIAQKRDIVRRIAEENSSSGME
jgi:hypothetical protein